ncbi:MAG: DapH/DapD/GlmU-related protein [Bauldia sp.]
MPVDHSHAFAYGPLYPSPERMKALRPSRPKMRAAKALWAAFRSSAIVAEDALLGPNAVCINDRRDANAIQIGSGAIVRGILRLNGFGEGPIVVGAGSYIGDDVIISAASGVRIGDEVLISHGVSIFDNDSHPMDWRARRAHYAAIRSGGRCDVEIATRPVTIGDYCWIAMNSTILKGTSIGDRSVVSAGSVVRGDFGRDCRISGNPARAIG